MTIAEDIIEHVEFEDDNECWISNASINSSGYSYCYFRGKPTGVHIVAYITRYGEYDRSLEIDHTCKTRNCYNPNHLQAVTTIQHKNLYPLWRTRNDTCPNGHPYTRQDKWGRKCNVCRREQSLRSYYNRKQIS